MEVMNRKSLKVFRRRLRADGTLAERLLWSYLRNKKMGVRWCRQYSIGNFIADFCCPTKRIAVEIDGYTHDDPEVQKRDRIKDSTFASYNFTVLRYADEEVRKNPAGVAEQIYRIVSNAP